MNEYITIGVGYQGYYLLKYTDSYHTLNELQSMMDGGTELFQCLTEQGKKLNL